jgi:hypothetical protein
MSPLTASSVFFVGPIVGGHERICYPRILAGHPPQQRANVILRYAPILPFTPLEFFVVDRPTKSLKCVGKTEWISPQILIDVPFNQKMAMRSLRTCEDPKGGQARPKPVNFASRISPHDGKS